MNQIDQLQTRLNRCKIIWECLSGSEPFRMFVEDCQENVKFADNSWHLLTIDKPELFHELKYSKLGALMVVQAMDKYKTEIEMLENKIKELKDPDYKASYVE